MLQNMSIRVADKNKQTQQAQIDDDDYEQLKVDDTSIIMQRKNVHVLPPLRNLSQVKFDRNIQISNL